MSLVNTSASRDNNRVPLIVDGWQIASNIQTFTGDIATVVTPIFTVTGSVEIRAIWGVVTTVLGVNHTASAFRLNDQTNQSNITLNTGTDISAAPVGSTIVKKGVAGTAVTLLSSSQERVSEPTTLETIYFSPFLAVKKSTALTQIEYVYATTDSPTSGAMQFFCRFIPLSSDGNLIIV